MAVAPDSSCQVVQPGLRALHRDWWVISNTKSVIFWDHLGEEQSLNTIQHKKFIISSKGLFERLMHDLQNTKKWALRALLLNFSTFVVFFFKEIHFPWKHRSQLSKHHLASCGCACVPSPERTSPWWWQSSILCVGTCARRWTPGCRYDPPPRSAWCTAFDQSSEMKCLGLPLAWRWGEDRKLKTF